MELHSAVGAGSTAVEANSSSSLTGRGKSPDPTSAEMRSAFESVIGSLMGLLTTAPQMTPLLPSGRGGESAATAGLTDQMAERPSLESLYALLSGKAAQTGKPGQPLAAAGQPAVTGLTPEMAQGQPAGETAKPDATFPPASQLQPAGAETPLLQPTPEGGPQLQTLAGRTSPGQQISAALPTADETVARPQSAEQATTTAQTDSANAFSGVASGVQVTPMQTAKAGAAPGPSGLQATPTEQIGEQIQVSLARGENDATIQLHPRELGSVRIRLQMENGQLHLSIRAEQADTGRMLDSRLADLRQSLEGQGIKVGELAVARNERTLAGEANAREIAPTVRSGQMDMNQNGSQDQRQSAAFSGESFGERGFGGERTPAQGQSGGERVEGTAANDQTARRSPRAADGATGVDYYA